MATLSRGNSKPFGNLTQSEFPDLKTVVVAEMDEAFTSAIYN